MKRALSVLLAPEVTAAFIAGAVFLFWARQTAGSPGDLELLEQGMWWLAFFAVPLAFATIFVPGVQFWWWLGRGVSAVSATPLPNH